MYMVLLKLLGYAVGSILMYWGLLLLLVSPWLFGLLLFVLINAAWNQVTGQTDEWKWFLRWTEFVVQAVHRLKVEWIGWLPGILVQIWYAGYAANLARTSALDKPRIDAIALQGMGCLGVLVASVTFYCLYHLVVDVKLNQWIHTLVGGISLVAYLILLQHPQAAEVLSESWEKIFANLLSAHLLIILNSL